MIQIVDNLEIDGNFYTPDDLMDLFRLQKQLLIEEGIFATIEDCANIWCRYSNDLSASWLFFPENDDDILKYIKSSDYFISFFNYAE